ncbi:hypothetical protein L7F22_001313 [Adiantum nelumboides]|nr:hypothetical protein [Adiantum nelumboides]
MIAMHGIVHVHLCLVQSSIRFQILFFYILEIARTKKKARKVSFEDEKTFEPIPTSSQTKKEVPLSQLASSHTKKDVPISKPSSKSKQSEQNLPPKAPKPPIAQIPSSSKSTSIEKSASQKPKPSLDKKGVKPPSGISNTGEEKKDNVNDIGESSKRKVTYKRNSGKPVQLKPITIKRKFKQGVRCLMEIRRAVKALQLAIPKLPFQRLCRQVAEEYKIDMRWIRTALACIQEVAEDSMVELFHDAYILAAPRGVHLKLIKYMIESNKPLQEVFEDDDDVEVLSKKGKGKLSKEEDQKDDGKNRKRKEFSSPTRRSPRSPPAKEKQEEKYEPSRTKISPLAKEKDVGQSTKRK